LQRPDGFRSFAELLAPVEALETAETQTASPTPAFNAHDITRELRLFNAHLNDALQRATETLLECIADDVVARECLWAPPDIQQIINNALVNVAPVTPLTIRVSPSDAATVTRATIPVESANELDPGDVELLFSGGKLCSTMRTRLDGAIVRALMQIEND